MSKNPDLYSCGAQIGEDSTGGGVRTRERIMIIPWVQGTATAAIQMFTWADLLLRQRVGVALLAVACLVFLLMQRCQVATGVRRTSTVLMLLTVVLLPVIEKPMEALASGVRIGGLIASLLISVNLLSRAAHAQARC